MITKKDVKQILKWLEEAFDSVLMCLGMAVIVLAIIALIQGML